MGNMLALCLYMYESGSESITCSVLSDYLRLRGLTMGFSRQEYWSGFPFPSSGDLPNPGIKPGSPACRQMLYHLS